MIYVFGSCVMDLLVPLPRLPRPGETVLGESYEMRPGGKGANQAVAAVRAGGLVSFFGAVGEDAFGRELRRSLEEEGIEPDGLAIVERPSAAALVMIGPNGENQIAVAAGANLEALAEQVPDAVLTSESLVVMQMEVRPEENWALLRRIRELGGRSMLNVAPALSVPAEMLPLIDILVVNEHEGALLGREHRLEVGGAAGLVTSLRDRTGGTVVMTLGAQGSVAATSAGVLSVPALVVDVIDSTGAGDAYVGALAAALDAGLDWPEALRRASACGSLACRGMGARTAMPDFDDIEEGARQLALAGN
jgi:ribokinase